MEGSRMRIRLLQGPRSKRRWGKQIQSFFIQINIQSFTFKPSTPIRLVLVIQKLSFQLETGNLQSVLRSSNQRQQMRGKKPLYKKNQSKLPIPNNQTLLGFIKIDKTNQRIQQNIQQPQIRVPKFIRIPNSSGEGPQNYPSDPVIIYPKNPQFRDYQFYISMECIKFNTLVCLPTGLGKTHVASILITNFTLWFPESKIFFLAPTRPLVRQQRQSLKWFYEKIGIENVYEMNGQIAAHKRQKIYESKRVFFATPQTFANDLKEGRLNPLDIKLLIFDQAHRAVGNSAYAQSIRTLNKTGACCRIIGLSATPGNEKEKIQEVISNLNIVKMVYKDEEEPDVKRHFFNREIHPVVIEPPSIIQEVQLIIDGMIAPYLRFLISVKIADPWLMKSKINSGLFFVIFQNFNQKKNILDASNSDFAYSSLKIIKFLIDSKQDLIKHGYETFRSKFFRQIQNFVLDESDDQEVFDSLTENEAQLDTKISHKSNMNNNSKSTKLPTQNLPKKFRQKIIQTEGYQRIKELFNPKSNVINHPKLQKLRQILQRFFKQAFCRMPSGKINLSDKNLDPILRRSSKCIVFTHYRSTAHEIKTYLSNSQFIKSQLFHGQSKTHIYEDHYNDEGEYENSKQSTLFLNQKQQISIISKFRQGEINTLIATSIGEQGLDIGEVDCIVCYDGGYKSPIRSIQRFGRTGRKRDGVVYLLLMKGTQELDYKKGLEKIRQMKRMLKQNQFLYYGYNVSLLKEQSEVKVTLYENQIIEAPVSEKKQKLKKETKNKNKKKKGKQEVQDTDQDEELKQEQTFSGSQDELESKLQSKSQSKQQGKNINDDKLDTNAQFLQKLFDKDNQLTIYQIDDQNTDNQQKDQLKGPKPQEQITHIQKQKKLNNNKKSSKSRRSRSKSSKNISAKKQKTKAKPKRSRKLQYQLETDQNQTKQLQSPIENCPNQSPKLSSSERKSTKKKNSQNLTINQSTLKQKSVQLTTKKTHQELGFNEPKPRQNQSNKLQQQRTPQTKSVQKINQQQLEKRQLYKVMEFGDRLSLFIEGKSDNTNQIHLDQEEYVKMQKEWTTQEKIREFMIENDSLIPKTQKDSQDLIIEIKRIDRQQLIRQFLEHSDSQQSLSHNTNQNHLQHHQLQTQPQQNETQKPQTLSSSHRFLKQKETPVEQSSQTKNKAAKIHLLQSLFSDSDSQQQQRTSFASETKNIPKQEQSSSSLCSSMIEDAINKNRRNKLTFEDIFDDDW